MLQVVDGTYHAHLVINLMSGRLSMWWCVLPYFDWSSLRAAYEPPFMRPPVCLRPVLVSHLDHCVGEHRMFLDCSILSNGPFRFINLARSAFVGLWVIFIPCGVNSCTAVSETELICGTACYLFAGLSEGFKC